MATKRRPMIYWTEKEAKAVARRFVEIMDSPKYAHLHPRFRRAAILRDAQADVLPVARLRLDKDSWTVYASIEPFMPQMHSAKKSHNDKKVSVDKRDAIRKASKPLAELLMEKAKVEQAMAAHPDHPEPLQTKNMAASIDDAIKRFAGDLGSAIGLYVMQSLERLIESTMMPVIEKKLEALQLASTTGLTEALDKLVQDAPAPTAMVVTTTEPLPTDVETVALAPRDRKPRVAIIGLIRQQSDEVTREFGDVMDFTFVSSALAGADVANKLAGVDVIVIMARFISHSQDGAAKKSGRPIMRITGSVSMLKAWLQKWFNGEVGLAGAPAQDRRDGGE